MDGDGIRSDKCWNFIGKFKKKNNFMSIAHTVHIKKEHPPIEFCYSGSCMPPRKHDSSRIKSREPTQGC